LVTAAGGKRKYDYLVVATGARHAYEVIPGLREFAVPWRDASRIMEAKKTILNFREGKFFAG
jgi:NADH dehydrogenase FAD-containing subunit